MNHPYLTWFLILLGVFPLTSVLLVMVGQPIRPFGHLMRASLFWTLVAWIGVALWLVTVRS